MLYIAALDHDHLDNGVFLSTLAQSLAQQQDKPEIRSIIVHTDSDYTERIIQTGVMREEATIRSIKDLNKRLVALFADQGVSTIGINPYKRNFITLQDGKLALDHAFLEGLSSKPVLLLSTLVQDVESQQQAVMPLPRMLRFLYEELHADELFMFSKSDESEIFTNIDEGHSRQQWENISSSFKSARIPDDLTELNHRVRLTTARDFNQLPNTDQTIMLE